VILICLEIGNVIGNIKQVVLQKKGLLGEFRRFFIALCYVIVGLVRAVD